MDTHTHTHRWIEYEKGCCFFRGFFATRHSCKSTVCLSHFGHSMTLPDLQTSSAQISPFPTNNHWLVQPTDFICNQMGSKGQPRRSIFPMKSCREAGKNSITWLIRREKKSDSSHCRLYLKHLHKVIMNEFPKCRFYRSVDDTIGICLVLQISVSVSVLGFNPKVFGVSFFN